MPHYPGLLVGTANRIVRKNLPPETSQMGSPPCHCHVHTRRWRWYHWANQRERIL